LAGGFWLGGFVQVVSTINGLGASEDGQYAGLEAIVMGLRTRQDRGYRRDRDSKTGIS